VLGCGVFRDEVLPLLLDLTAGLSLAVLPNPPLLEFTINFNWRPLYEATWVFEGMIEVIMMLDIQTLYTIAILNSLCFEISNLQPSSLIFLFGAPPIIADRPCTQSHPPFTTLPHFERIVFNMQRSTSAAASLVRSALRSGIIDLPKFSNTGSLSLIARGFASDASLKKTALYDFHVEHGGKSPMRLIPLPISPFSLQLHPPPPLSLTHKHTLLPTHPYSQVKWSHLPAGPCQSNTKTPSWSPLSTVEHTPPSLTSLTCVALPSPVKMPSPSLRLW
jgi:hypothetical protein